MFLLFIIKGNNYIYYELSFNALDRNKSIFAMSVWKFHVFLLLEPLTLIIYIEPDPIATSTTERFATARGDLCCSQFVIPYFIITYIR